MKDCSCAETSVAALLTVKAHRYIQHKYEAPRAQNDKDSFHIKTMEQSHDCLHCNFSLGLLCQAWSFALKGGMGRMYLCEHRCVYYSCICLWFLSLTIESIFESFLFYSLLPSLNMCSCCQLCRPRVSNIGSVIWGKDPWLSTGLAKPLSKTRSGLFHGQRI